MITINAKKCIGCGKCITDCFPHDISLIDQKAIPKNVSCINCGHCVAVCPQNAVSMDHYDMREVKEYDKDSFSISSERLLNFIKFRRSVRQFKNLPVEKEKLEQIIEAGRFTQTASNMQDVSFTVIEDTILPLKKLVMQTLKDMGKELIDSKTEDIRLRRYGVLWHQMWSSYQKDPIAGDRLFFNAPCIIAISSSFEVDGALAASNMELMADALGLGTFFSGFFVAATDHNPAIKDMLSLKDDKKLICCMVIGYPSITYQRTVPRKKPDIIWK